MINSSIENNNSIKLNRNQYNFSNFIFNSLVSEKILYLLSLIAEKNDLKRTKVIIYINLLDLSPIYNIKLRSFILGDLYNFCFDTYKKYIKRKSLRENRNNKDNRLLCQMILARHKIRCLYFSSKPNIIKNVVLLFDLNFPILKDRQFLINFKKYFHSKDNKNYSYIAFFDERLFLFKNFNKHHLEKSKNFKEENEQNFFNRNSFNYINRTSIIKNTDGNQIENEIQKNKNLENSYSPNKKPNIDKNNILSDNIIKRNSTKQNTDLNKFKGKIVQMSDKKAANKSNNSVIQENYKLDKANNSENEICLNENINISNNNYDSIDEDQSKFFYLITLKKSLFI